MQVVIVGAGPWGVHTAVSLRAAGHDVTIIDPRGPGGGSASRAAGIVHTGQWHPLDVRLTLRSAAMLRDNLADLGPVRWHDLGSTTLVSPAQRDAARALATLQREAGAPVDDIDPADLPKLKGHAGIATHDVAAAYRLPADGWALPRIALEITIGRRLHELTLVREAAELGRDADGHLIVRAGGRVLRADATLIAAGVWTRGLLAQADIALPLAAYRTQLARILVPDGHAFPILHDAIHGSYHRPHWFGQMLAGNGTTTTPEDVDAWQDQADDAFVSASLHKLAARWPTHGPFRIAQSWAGLDVATPDRHPLIGRLPGHEDDNVWLAVGGQGRGIMRGPAIGEALAAMMQGHRPRFDMTPFAPARFASHYGQAGAGMRGGGDGESEGGGEAGGDSVFTIRPGSAL